MCGIFVPTTCLKQITGEGKELTPKTQVVEPSRVPALPTSGDFCSTTEVYLIMWAWVNWQIDAWKISSWCFFRGWLDENNE